MLKLTGTTCRNQSASHLSGMTPPVSMAERSSSFPHRFSKRQTHTAAHRRDGDVLMAGANMAGWSSSIGKASVKTLPVGKAVL
jgi:hypothetical protein